MKRTLGFTIIELLVVFAIILVVVALLMSGFLNYARYQEYQATIAQIALELSEVQADSKVALQDQNHGFNIGTDRITFYIGDFYNALDPTNEVVEFNNVTFSPNLTGGATDVRLNKVTGLPTATGTIDVIGTSYNGTTTITITKAGVLYYE